MCANNTLIVKMVELIHKILFFHNDLKDLKINKSIFTKFK
jgi:hypothetical protein